MIPDSAIDQTIASLLETGGEEMRVLGISGPPGTGKSTLALRVLARAQSLRSCDAALLSLDDVYLTKATRVELSTSFHPLAAFRGPPGTHDLSLLKRTINALARAHPGARTPLPRFDKLTDDRKPPGDWPIVEGKPQLVILDGWCLGALPVAPESLITPVNERERTEDPDGRYRSHVNEKLRDYASIAALLDARVHIEASWEDVVRFREEQERMLEVTAGARFFTPEGVRTFLQLFQRVALGPFEREKLLWTAEIGGNRKTRAIRFESRS